MPAEHEAARSVAVEPVRGLRPARQAEAQVVEAIGQCRTAFRPGMNGQTGRLVDDEHQGIAVEEADAYVSRSHGAGLEPGTGGSKYG
ncbi:hypothetical protein GCM10007887_17240 [Methylobacterium haplocladii]|uniref:Uncharacterized protein n=1 Tax=Methylobacterium haplocladii TaxID=1176176 RepID=A0A512IK76_9HYPH|nr:hypothetical protein MHA02_04790 [Methylobacterium haplocladii]GLS59058.1 hypothetical protein GCM10007887_17240 [Methylobacterium haplocladii]